MTQGIKMSTEKGKVKWFNRHFGYGFIVGKDGDDVFVHYTVISQDQSGAKRLKPGEVVYYTVKTSDEGQRATRVYR